MAHNLKPTVPHVVADMTARGLFYGILLSGVKRREQTGVRMQLTLQGGYFLLAYDPAWFDTFISYGASEASLAVQAVMYACGHFQRAIRMLFDVTVEERPQARVVLEAAMMLTASEILHADPQFTEDHTDLCDEQPVLTAPRLQGVLYELTGKELPIPRHASLEVYYEILLPYAPDVKKSLERIFSSEGGGPPEPFLPALPDNLDDAPSLVQQLDEQSKRLIHDAMTRAQRAGTWGLVPGDVQQIIAELLRPTRLPWWERVRQQITATHSSHADWSMTVLSRQRSEMVRLDPRNSPLGDIEFENGYRLWIFVDTSGSVCEEDLRKLLGVADVLLAQNSAAEVHVLQGDTELTSDERYQAGGSIPPVVKGRGGTSCRNWFEVLRQKARAAGCWPDLIVIATDGGFEDVPDHERLPAEVPLLWLMTTSGVDPIPGCGGMWTVPIEH